MLNTVVLAFLLLLPQPWQTMHTGQTWHTHGWACVVTAKTPERMSWGCSPPTARQAPVSAPVTAPVTNRLEPCQAPVVWPRSIMLWQIPPTCYGAIYYEGYGDCFGWVKHLEPHVAQMSAHWYPRAGAVVHINPYNQGASPAGHWAVIVAISPNHQWALISEENMYWRGGGYNRVNFRYLYLNTAMSFLW